jgi:hypothetical protein
MPLSAIVFAIAIVACYRFSAHLAGDVRTEP